MGDERNLPLSAASALIEYHRTTDLVADSRAIIDQAQSFAQNAVNVALVQRNWLLGKRIAEEDLGGERADYGDETIKELADKLTEKYGKGFSKRNLYSFLRFYRSFPTILQTPSAKSHRLLSWSHYVELLRVTDDAARAWYEQEAAGQNWSVRTLQRNISTLYYERLLIL